MATRNQIASDNFNRASLGADWEQVNSSNGGSITIDSSIRATGSVAGGGSGSATARWIGAGSFTNDQYAVTKIVNLQYLAADYGMGVVCRASGDTDTGRDYYYAFVSHDKSGPSYTTSLGKVVNGTNTTLHSATSAWADGDTVELEVEGTTLRVLKNGTALGGSFTQTDSSLSSGVPGLVVGGGTVYADDWSGGNLVADQVPTGTSGGLVVGSATSFVGEGFVGAIEAAGNTQPTGLATETDTALGLTRRKSKATQLATETDAALALVAAHARTAGLAVETDAALALAKQKARATGLASETETALALGRVKAKAAGLAIETDSALAVSRRKTRSAGRADETDTALALGAPLAVGRADEVDSALALARVKSKAAGLATTTETAFALTPRKIRVCGTAAETDTALALAPGAVSAVGRADETDTAFSLARQKARATGLASETDTALAPGRVKVKAAGLATEIDTALALARLKIRACGRADETDTAFALPPLGVITRPVGLAVETDAALALAALVLAKTEPPAGGDDVPDRGHRGWDRKRSRLKLHREREFTEQIRELYRELAGDPRTAERAEAILAPVVAAVAAAGESEAAREAALEARADALRARADAFEAEALQAEIGLRLLHRELREEQEADDVDAIQYLLAQVL